MNVKSFSIDLKGSIFTLLVLRISTICIEKISISLEKKMKQLPNFFSKNTPVVVNVSKINNSINWKNLHQVISNAGLFVIGVCCCHDNNLKKKIIRSGLPILTQGKNIVNFNNLTDSIKSVYENKNLEFLKTQVIYTPVRSGQRIYAQNRDLIIISNVSSGAEIISDGNIHIYGTIRGRVLAGASGNKESQIFCTNLFSELISIGGYYWINEQIPKEFLGKSVRIYLKDNNLVMKHIL